MEKPNFGMNAGIRLPIGYRFHPTDEELLVHYLKRKVFGVPLPASVIPEFDVFQTDPWNLPGDLKEKRYFFSKKKGNDKRTAAAGSGYWKLTGKGRQILASVRNQPVGIRETLVFNQGKNSCKTKTRWFMHEYRLVGAGTNPNTSQISTITSGDWMVYCIFQKKRKPAKHGIISKSTRINKTQTVERSSPGLIDLKVEEGFVSALSQPSSPCSSGITEVSSNELDQEEISSFINIDFSD